MLTDSRRIGVVGNCVAGKSTLVEGLKGLGYQAINIPQEHSVSQRFWRRVKPDFLVYLSCTLEVARSRRKIPWGQERLDEQWAILSDARENADLRIDTDPLGVEEVLEIVLRALGQSSPKYEE